MDFVVIFEEHRHCQIHFSFLENIFVGTSIYEIEKVHWNTLCS